MHLQIAKFLAEMRTGGEAAIGVLPHVAIEHGVNEGAIVGLGTVLGAQKEMGIKSQPRKVRGTCERWMLVKCRFVPDHLLRRIKRSEYSCAVVQCFGSYRLTDL